MKFLIVASLMVFGLNAFADSAPCQEEAQFIGKVKNIKPLNQDWSMCSFQIEFTMYNESMVCPLNSGEADHQTFYDAGCNYKDGEQVSGYLVRKGAGAIQWEGH
jgi:hypothetical protein